MTIPVYAPGQLLAVLERIEREVLPALVRDSTAWQSLFVDYEPPFVERLWAPVQLGDEAYRVFLHRIHPAPLDACLFHPHPWPSAIRLLSGTYRMNTGAGAGMEPPAVTMQLKLAAGTAYEMGHPDGWHAVSPIGEPSYSLMVTGKPWTRPSHKPTKQLHPLETETAAALLKFFQDVYGKE